MPCLNRKQIWHKTFVKGDVNIEVLKIETSLMLGQSLEEDPRVSIVGNFVISKRIVNTLGRRKALLMMLNLENFMMIKTLKPLQPVRKSCYSFVNKLV